VRAWAALHLSSAEGRFEAMHAAGLTELVGRCLKRRVGLQLADSRHQLRPRSHRSLCVVLVGLGIAEVDQDPIAHVLRNKAAQALNGFGDALLIG
jgi:hypothetical protein